MHGAIDPEGNCPGGGGLTRGELVVGQLPGEGGGGGGLT